MPEPQIQHRVSQLQEERERSREAEKRWQEERKDSWTAYRKEANKILGDMARKMGTIAEDFVAPSVPKILRQIAISEANEVELLAMNMMRRHPKDRSQTCTMDALAVTDELALLVEVRYSLRPEDIPLAVRKFESAREFFAPEIEDRRIVGAVAAIYLDPSLVTHAERKGLLVLGLGLGEYLMDIKNSEGFEPKPF